MKSPGALISALIVEYDAQKMLVQLRAAGARGLAVTDASPGHPITVEYRRFVLEHLVAQNRVDRVAGRYYFGGAS